MAHIPLFCGDAAASVMAVMAFPDDPEAADTWASRWLANGPVQNLRAAGGTMPPGQQESMLRGASRDVVITDRFNQSCREGEAVGKIMATLFRQINEDRSRATMGRALLWTLSRFRADGVPLGKSTARSYLDRKRRVLHLWCGIQMRGFLFNNDPMKGPIGPEDVRLFLHGCERVLDVLIEWAKSRDQFSGSYLESDHYRANPNWQWTEPPTDTSPQENNPV